MSGHSAPLSCFIVPFPCLPRGKRSRCVSYSGCSILRSHVVLGGSSGVGSEVMKYLKSTGNPVESFSRSNGFDFLSSERTRAALVSKTGGVAVCIGGGRRHMCIDEEMSLYGNAIDAICAAPQLTVVVAVVRAVVLAEVQNVFSSKLQIPWVLLRPGPLVDLPHPETSVDSRERLLVTSDIRCNGLVSRRGVARVAGDLMLGKVATNEVNKKVFGVYDEERMIFCPHGSRFIGTKLWRGP